MTTTVGIAGITGKFGSLLAAKLLLNPTVRVRGYCRSPSKLSPELAASPNMTLYAGDASDVAAVKSFVHGCDVVACSYLGSSDFMFDSQKLLIDACEEHKVPRYIASDWSIDYTRLQLGDLFPKDPMLHVKAYVETKKHVKGVHILIGGFMSTLFAPFFQLWNSDTRTLKYWGTGEEVYEASTYENSAEYTAAIAVDKDAVGIQRFVGGVSSVPHLAEIIEKTHGFSPKLQRMGSLEELYTQMHATRTKNPKEVFKYMAMFYTYYMLSGKTFIGPAYDNSRYPEINAVSWEDFIKQQSF
ncbi:nmrA-like family protein [Xylariales sp. PMI_506]|nr:nmrA-like family protein [Xylariales sp. PMI_506]